ncbi:hypothetical protein B0H13DRAFT_1963951 [Mycena leptocephala]|nr:hypothetical protein B0H13DRAFT_1963951 [Mycena leptocephala]
MGIGVKLESLSSCVPLGLGLPPSTNSSGNGNGYTNAHAHAPLNAHLLPTGAAKRFSLPVLPPPLSLDTQSSSYGYPAHVPAYHGHADDYPPSSASTYTDTSDSGSRRGSFDPPFPPFALERGVKRGYEQHRYEHEEEPAVYGGHPLDHHSDMDHHNHSQRAFPLEAGYAVSSSPSFPFPRGGGPHAHEQGQGGGGMRTTSGRPRAVSDVLGLALGRRGGAWDGVGGRSGLGISLNMGLTRGSSVGAGARSMSSGSTGSTDDSSA